MLSYIQNILFVNATQIESQVLEFFVRWVVIKWKNWDSIVDVEGEAETVVVEDKDIFKHSVLYYTKVFDVTVFSIDTVLTI